MDYYLINKDGLYMEWYSENGYTVTSERIDAENFLGLEDAKEVMRQFPYSGFSWVPVVGVKNRWKHRIPCSCTYEHDG